MPAVSPAATESSEAEEVTVPDEQQTPAEEASEEPESSAVSEEPVTQEEIGVAYEEAVHNEKLPAPALKLFARKNTAAQYMIASTFTGDGSQENPYLIQFSDDWDTLSSAINSGDTQYNGKHFKLTQNISVTTVLGTRPGSSDSQDRPFSGTPITPTGSGSLKLVAAGVENNGETRYFDSIATAADSANWTAGSTLKLLADVTTSSMSEMFLFSMQNEECRIKN